MNYRALEDLIGILVKKAGFKLNDLKVEEDIDFLEERKKYLEGEIETLKVKLGEASYLDKDERLKDEEEKKYLEESLSNLRNSLSELEEKMKDKNTKANAKRKLESERTLLDDEIRNLEELLKLVNLKLDNKAYFDVSAMSKDETSVSSLQTELENVNNNLRVKHDNPVILGNKLLEAFKDNKAFEDVKDIFEKLVGLAKSEYDKTSKEIKDSNIFELMDRYTSKKRDTSQSLESSDYNSDKIKQDLFEKERYHNSRLESFKGTLESIERRKDELRVLIDESRKLYEGVCKDRERKEDMLSNITTLLYGETNLVLEEDEYRKQVNDLRNEIIDDKYLENKYNRDIQSFKDEVKNLDINYTNIQNEMVCEERSLEIVHEKLSSAVLDLVSKFQDKVNFLVYSNRVDSLVNEQQYLYVNVDVIRDEVISLWNKGEDSSSVKEMNEEEPLEEATQEVEVPLEEETEVLEELEETVVEDAVEETENFEATSMYDEELPNDGTEELEVIDYLE